VRPRINEHHDEEEQSDEERNSDDDEESHNQQKCTKPIADVIRKCWTSEPSERPTFNWVIEQLNKEISFYRKSNEMEAISQGSSDDDGSRLN